MNYYSLKEVSQSLENLCILHALEFMNTKVWDDNCIYPFCSFYKNYRNLWDPDCEKEPNDNRNSKRKSRVYLKLLADSFLLESTLRKVKSKYKKFAAEDKMKS